MKPAHSLSALLPTEDRPTCGLANSAVARLLLLKSELEPALVALGKAVAFLSFTQAGRQVILVFLCGFP